MSSESDAGEKKWKFKKILAIITGLLLMIIGSFVDRYVQGFLDATGMFGPSLDQMIDDQNNNFNQIKTNLLKISESSNPAEIKQIVGSLNELLLKQENYVTKTHEALRDYNRQLASLREKELEKGSIAGGADFFLMEGQTISVASRDNVFSIRSVENGGYVDYMFNNSRSSFSPGRYITVKTSDSKFRLYNKGPSSDNPLKIGFDLVKIEENGKE